MSIYLETNLQLFKGRYPREWEGVASVVNQPINPDYKPRAPISSFTTLKIPDEIKYVKVLLLAGVLDPTDLRSLLSQKALNETQVIFLVENDPDAVRHAFHNLDLTQLIIAPNIIFMLGQVPSQWGKAFYEAFRQPPLTDVFTESVSIYHPGMAAEEYQYYIQLAATFNDTGKMLLSNLGEINDYMEGIRATAANDHFIRTAPGIEDLQDFYKDRPCVIVGAGPSLDEALPKLKANQNKVVIIATDAAVRPLLEAGIRVDFATSIERWLDIQVGFWDGLTGPNLPQLVALPVVHTKVLKAYQGPIRIAYRNYGYYLHWNKQVPKGILHSFSSAGHLAFRLARYMGCSKFYLVGVDSCYHTKSDGKYKSHGANSAFPDWALERTREEWEAYRPKYKPYFITTNNRGEEALTNQIYEKWGREWTQEALVLNLFGSIISTDEQGLRMDFVQYEPLDQVFAALPEFEVQRAPYTPTNFTGSLNYDELYKQLRSYHRIFKECSQELEHLQTSGFKDVQGVLALMSTLNGYMKQDPFRASWIDQNCTRESAEILNRIARLSLDPANDTKDEWKQRLIYLLALLDTLMLVCDKIEISIKRGLEDGEQIFSQATTSRNSTS